MKIAVVGRGQQSPVAKRDVLRPATIGGRVVENLGQHRVIEIALRESLVPIELVDVADFIHRIAEEAAEFSVPTQTRGMADERLAVAAELNVAAGGLDVERVFANNANARLRLVHVAVEIKLLFAVANALSGTEATVGVELQIVDRGVGLPRRVRRQFGASSARA